MANAKNTEAPVVVNENTDDNDAIGTDVETANINGAVDVGSILASMNDQTKVISTIKGEDFDARLTLAGALTNSVKLKSALNTIIEVVDYVITEVTFVSKETGEVVNAPRCVIIDVNGDAYHATSMGVLTALRNIRLAVGELWGQQPVKIKPVQQQGNNGWEFITLQVVR